MEKYAKIENEGTVKFEREFPNEVGEVWEYLINSDKRGLWLASGEMDTHPGGNVKLIFQHRNLSQEDDPIPEKYKDKADGEVVEGKIREIKIPDILSFTWSGNSVVTFELRRFSDLTHLFLTHSNLAKDRNTFISICAGWHTHLNILSDRLEDLEPKGFWSVYNKLEAEYSERLSSIDQL
ncbi:SRPBCC family protein [Zunongwangia sp. F363]|uniref:SRPBCC family protein n=1 Tax=Autumnicola tepida TaxID=3075595 RepID=A0ABU3C6I7_9FLAO|nr:SRPBCC family protein [Zunongwangia sp. F363]MDT0641787.1 SRPBCC family protein [Zunongwangia sp. F363]